MPTIKQHCGKLGSFDFVVEIQGPPLADRLRVVFLNQALILNILSRKKLALHNPQRFG